MTVVYRTRSPRSASVNYRISGGYKANASASSTRARLPRNNTEELNFICGRFFVGRYVRLWRMRKHIVYAVPQLDYSQLRPCTPWSKQRGAAPVVSALCWRSEGRTSTSSFRRGPSLRPASLLSMNKASASTTRQSVVSRPCPMHWGERQQDRLCTIIVVKKSERGGG